MTTTDSRLAELERLARRAAESDGVDVAWCELKGSKGAPIFRVFIERADGQVGLSDCERVSKRLSLLLDVADPIESSYTLEVSTPGLNRPLHRPEDYQRFAGKLARVKTTEPVDGRRRFVGRLGGVADGAVLLEEREGHRIEIPMNVIDNGRLEVEIDPPSRRRSRKRA